MIVPSIDLMQGQAVQLVGGREKVLDAGDPRPIAEQFRLAGEIAVVDLDAALGRGANAGLIRELLRIAPCRVGGGIRAAEAARAWLDAGCDPGIVAVNLSSLQFKAPIELERDIAAILKEAGLEASRIELELTETVLMDTSREHNDVLQRLRQSGLRLAIDDFGTGYSSLDYLRRFPVDRIKIAQIFMVDLATVPSNAAIVKATIALALALNLGVIAEGVETAEQLDMLRTWGCRQAQGFYFSRPLPPAATAEFLARNAAPRSPITPEPG